MPRSIRRTSTRIAAPRVRPFAIWITGLPASGKSTLARALRAQLERRGIPVAVLESDALRVMLLPDPRYDAAGRNAFYALMTYIGERVLADGISVIFDATANLRAYRDAARHQIQRFLEVFVDCPLETCLARDPKGIYRQAQAGAASNVPGLQAAYESPVAADVVVHSGDEPPYASARRVVAKLAEKGYL